MVKKALRTVIVTFTMFFAVADYTSSIAWAEDPIPVLPVRRLQTEKEEDSDLIIEGKIKSVTPKNQFGSGTEGVALIRRLKIIKGTTKYYEIEVWYRCFNSPGLWFSWCPKVGDEDTFYLKLREEYDLVQ